LIVRVASLIKFFGADLKVTFRAKPKKAIDVFNGDLPAVGDNCDYFKWNQEIIKF
jgi:hypothetical protein